MLGRTYRKDPEENEQQFEVEKYIMHENFDPETFDNDIGKTHPCLLVGSEALVGAEGQNFHLTAYAVSYCLSLSP